MPAGRPQASRRPRRSYVFRPQSAGEADARGSGHQTQGGRQAACVREADTTAGRSPSGRGRGRAGRGPGPPPTTASRTSTTSATPRTSSRRAGARTAGTAPTRPGVQNPSFLQEGRGGAMSGSAYVSHALGSNRFLANERASAEMGCRVLENSKECPRTNASRPR